jgi:hypothetical protein
VLTQHMPDTSPVLPGCQPTSTYQRHTQLNLRIGFLISFDMAVLLTYSRESAFNFLTFPSINKSDWVGDGK